MKTTVASVLLDIEIRGYFNPDGSVEDLCILLGEQDITDYFSREERHEFLQQLIDDNEYSDADKFYDQTKDGTYE